MSDHLFSWYKSTKKRIKVWEENIEDGVEGAKQYHDELVSAIDSMDVIIPSLKERYDRVKAIESTFTRDQINHICFQIGDWYLKWRDCITEQPGVPHKLGYAKEQLKTMICGY